MNNYPRFLESELPELRAEECYFHIIPVPYEASISYGHGTADGPRAILEASSQLEVWTGRANPSALGIYTAPPVDCGDIRKPDQSGDTSGGSAPEVLGRIAAATNFSLKTGGLPILLGGEHSITPGALGVLKDKYGTFGVVHFDAHADLRQTYQGSRYSHACAMRRAADLGLPIFQLGVRSLSPEEVSYRKVSGIGHLDARELFQLGANWPGQQSAAGSVAGSASGATSGSGAGHSFLPANFPEKIFISFDVDALDPSILPATGTPEPGGLGWYQSLNLLEAACNGRQVIGADFVELAPKEGWPSSDFTVARLVYEFMGIAMPRA